MASTAADAAAPAVVLGAEPDTVTRHLIALYLEPMGYAVRIAPSVADALPALGEAGATAFVCSECALEDASPEQREALRLALPPLPVVVLTEPGAPPTFTRNWEGVRERLTKPVRADALLSVLQGLRPAPPGRPALSGEAPQAGSHAALLGFEQLIAEMKMEPTLVHELAASFLERAPAYLGEITGSLAEGDLTGVQQTAHTLKGMCGNLRFAPLVALSDRVRRAALSGDPEAARQALDEMRGELERVCGAVRERWQPAV